MKTVYIAVIRGKIKGVYSSQEKAETCLARRGYDPLTDRGQTEYLAYEVDDGVYDSPKSGYWLER